MRSFFLPLGVGEEGRKNLVGAYGRFRKTALRENIISVSVVPAF